MWVRLLPVYDTVLGDHVAPEAVTCAFDALVAVDRGVEDRGERAGVFENAAKESVSQFGDSQFFLGIVEQVGGAGDIPEACVGVAAIAGDMGERLGHEGCAQAVVLGDRLDHELEEGMPVGGHQHVVVVPVHLELAVGVLVIVLVGTPAQ